MKPYTWDEIGLADRLELKKMYYCDKCGHVGYSDKKTVKCVKCKRVVE